MQRYYRTRQRTKSCLSKQIGRICNYKFCGVLFVLIRQELVSMKELKLRSRNELLKPLT
jgi:hypothetical protein